MANCTFFGHRDCPETIKPKLREVLVDLITNHDVDMFYVGHQGQFDAYVHSELKKLKQEYPQINYAVVLAYMPGKKNEYDDYSDTMLPEKASSPSTHTTPSPGATIGCSNDPATLSPTSPTPGAALLNMLKKLEFRVSTFLI